MAGGFDEILLLLLLEAPGDDLGVILASLAVLAVPASPLALLLPRGALVFFTVVVVPLALVGVVPLELGVPPVLLECC